MSVDVESGVVLRMLFRTDMKLHYTAQTQVVQEIIDKGIPVGKNEHSFSSRVSQWVIRADSPEEGHILTVVEPQGDIDLSRLPPGVEVRRQAVYSHMDRRGQVLLSTGDGAATAYAFPVEPVKTGDSWEVKADVRFPGVPQPVPGKNTFVLVGAEEVAGYPCVRIEVRSSERNFEMPLPDGRRARVQVQTRGVLSFAPDPGVLVRLESITRSIPKIGDVTFDTLTRLEQTLAGVELPEAAP